MIGILAHRFFSWFKSNHNFLVFCYGIAMTLLSINAIFTFVYVLNILINQFTNVEPHIGHIVGSPGSSGILYSAYLTSSIVSFTSIWFATVLLLYNYSKRLQRAKFWILVSLPLVYFLSQFQPLILDLLSSFRQADPVSFGIAYTLILNVNKPAGGILFGIAFLAVARSITHNTVKDFMILSGYGLLLFFGSNQAIVLVNYPYPPFGLVTISFMGLSSYLIFIGIYHSAVSVSQDMELRRSVRKSIVQQYNLLDNIGTAEMDREIQKRVLTITREKQDLLAEGSGIESSLSEEEIKDYLQEVLKEVKEKKQG